MNGHITAYGIDWGEFELDAFSSGKPILEELINGKHTCLPKERSLKKQLIKSLNSDFRYFKIRGVVVFSNLAKGEILDHPLFQSLLEEFYIKWKWNEHTKNFDWEISSSYKMNYHLRANRNAAYELTALIDPRFAKEQRLKKMFDKKVEDPWLQGEQDRIETYIENLIATYLDITDVKEKAIDFIPEILIAGHRKKLKKYEDSNNKSTIEKRKRKTPIKKA